MSKLPALTPQKVIKVLTQRGFILDHSSGSHQVYYQPETKKRAVVPFHHRDIPVGTLLSILKQAGISRDELR
ncbi:MAG: type II toxin-antitoxin system HicA family toxin [Planctomycetes bacterium]|nr:type II toxin-antitoxin system HicA family toxin [Planctomycetota bacterium]